MGRYATTDELAARFRVTVETIRSWARRGKIPSVRVGRRPLLFDIDEVDRVLRERTHSQRMEEQR
jgi:excisionase family DNA binding protein